MKSKLTVLLLALYAAGIVSAQSNQTCDRACLESLVDRYMDALIAHDPTQVPLALQVGNTEDGVRLAPGDGFWRTAMAKGTYRLFNTDVEHGQVVFQGTMREVPNGGVVTMIRLKVANRQITEIENFVVRDAGAAAAMESRGQPDALFTATIPTALRASRDELIRTANAYFSGLERNDGKGSYPVADDCVRIQNGTQVTNNANAAQALAAGGGRGARGAGGARGGPGARGGARGGPGAPRGAAAAPPPAPAPAPAGPVINIYAMSCMDQLKSGYFSYVARVRDRRFVAVDRERGLVTAIVAVDQPSGKYRDFKLADGRNISAGPEKPTTVLESHTFKIEGGRIRRLETVQLTTVPYGMIGGWSTWEDGMSSNPRDVR